MSQIALTYRRVAMENKERFATLNQVLRRPSLKYNKIIYIVMIHVKNKFYLINILA